jgi:hypothetical protein
MRLIIILGNEISIAAILAWVQAGVSGSGLCAGADGQRQMRYRAEHKPILIRRLFLRALPASGPLRAAIFRKSNILFMI